MRRFYTTIAAVGLLALPAAGVALAATPQAEKASGKPQAQAEKSVAKEPTATGTIAKWDETSKTLTIKNSKGGESVFVLGSDCTIAEGTKTLTPNDLSTMSGQMVKVYHTGTPSGTMTAHRVVIEQPKSSAKASKMAASTSAAQPKKR